MSFDEDLALLVQHVVSVQTEATTPIRDLTELAERVGTRFGRNINEERNEGGSCEVFAALASGTSHFLEKFLRSEGKEDKSAVAACVVQLLRCVGNACFDHSVNRGHVISNSNWCDVVMHALEKLTLPGRLQTEAERSVLEVLLGALGNVVNNESAVFEHVWREHDALSSSSSSSSSSVEVLRPLVQFFKHQAYNEELDTSYCRMMALYDRLLDVPEFDNSDDGVEDSKHDVSDKKKHYTTRVLDAVLREGDEFVKLLLTSEPALRTPVCPERVSIICLLFELCTPSSANEPDMDPELPRNQLLLRMCAEDYALGSVFCVWLTDFRAARRRLKAAEDEEEDEEEEEDHWLSDDEDVETLGPRVSESFVRLLHMGLHHSEHAAAVSVAAAQFCTPPEGEGQASFDLYDLALASRLLKLVTQAAASSAPLRGLLVERKQFVAQLRMWTLAYAQQHGAYCDIATKSAGMLAVLIYDAASYASTLASEPDFFISVNDVLRGCLQEYKNEVTAAVDEKYEDEETTMQRRQVAKQVEMMRAKYLCALCGALRHASLQVNEDTDNVLAAMSCCSTSLIRLLSVVPVNEDAMVLKLQFHVLKVLRTCCGVKGGATCVLHLEKGEASTVLRLLRTAVEMLSQSDSPHVRFECGRLLAMLFVQFSSAQSDSSAAVVVEEFLLPLGDDKREDAPCQVLFREMTASPYESLQQEALDAQDAWSNKHK